MAITLGLTANQGGGKRGRRDSGVTRLLRMLRRFGTWMATRTDRVADVYLVGAGESAALYVVAKAEAYDFALSRELSEFSAPYLARGVLGDITLLPASSLEELEAFFDPKRAFRISFE